MSNHVPIFAGKILCGHELSPSFTLNPKTWSLEDDLQGCSHKHGFHVEYSGGVHSATLTAIENGPL